MNSPLVSILINNYNYGRYLKQAIDSALAQDYSHIEVIIVDDGSNDTSADVINNYQEDSIRAIFKENGGQASAFNTGFATCKGDIVCFLDSDDYFCPDKISRIVSIFQETPDIGWIFHKLDYVNQIGDALFVDDSNSGIDNSQVVDFRSTLKQGERFTYTIPCGLCFRREVLAKILPMPESKGVTISDNYLKYAALSLSPGLFLCQRLAIQRIHENNTYTLRDDNQRLRAEINIKTGLALRKNFPHIHLFTNKLFSRGCGEMIAESGVTNLLETPEFVKYIEDSSFSFWIKNLPKITYHAINFKLKRIKIHQKTKTH